LQVSFLFQREEKGAGIEAPLSRELRIESSYPSAPFKNERWFLSHGIHFDVVDYDPAFKAMIHVLRIDN